MTEQPTPKKVKVPVHLAPDQPPPFDPVIPAGLRALRSGTASDHQQRVVFEWLYKHLGALGSQSYRASDPYGTAFMEGRRFVGATMLNLADEKGE